jgi:hypothetical protein
LEKGQEVEHDMLVADDGSNVNVRISEDPTESRTIRKPETPNFMQVIEENLKAREERI